MVVGRPARIEAVRFSIDQILEHESKLFTVGKRMNKIVLEKLFAEYYEGKRVLGVAALEDPEKDVFLSYFKKLRNYVEPCEII